MWVPRRMVNTGADTVSQIASVAHVVSRVQGVPVEEVATAAWRNTMRVFFPREQ